MNNVKPSSLCPIARSLEHVGEGWSMLILREAFYGYTKFDEFQKNLGIAPNILTRRLKQLVESGLLEKRAYSERPPRYEYVLTPRGRDFRPVIWALVAWGNKHFAAEGEVIQIAHKQTGEIVTPILADPATGENILAGNYHIVAGPAASEGVRNKLKHFEESVS